MLQKIKYFLKYYSAAGTRYDVHSPLLASLMQQLYKPLPVELDRNITHYKKKLYKGNQLIPNLDLGAGSKSGQNPGQLALRSILKNAVSGRYKAGILYRVCHWARPAQILELGTSIGISAVIMQQASQSRVTTIEGNPHIAAIAAQTFEHFGLQEHIHLLNGPFDVFLHDLLHSEHVYELIYIDGNHTYEATMAYWSQILQSKAGRGSILIFDDIYWSAGMQSAWQEIVSSPAARYTVDTYQLGLVFTDPAIRTKQHHVVAAQCLKPWRLGFFHRQ